MKKFGLIGLVIFWAGLSNAEVLINYPMNDAAGLSLQDLVNTGTGGGRLNGVISTAQSDGEGSLRIQGGTGLRTHYLDASHTGTFVLETHYDSWDFSKSPIGYGLQWAVRNDTSSQLTIDFEKFSPTAMVVRVAGSEVVQMGLQGLVGSNLTIRVEFDVVLGGFVASCQLGDSEYLDFGQGKMDKVGFDGVVLIADGGKEVAWHDNDHVNVNYFLLADWIARKESSKIHLPLGLFVLIFLLGCRQVKEEKKTDAVEPKTDDETPSTSR